MTEKGEKVNFEISTDLKLSKQMKNVNMFTNNNDHNGYVV